MYLKTCANKYCHKTFETQSFRKKYCSNLCQEIGTGKKKYEHNSIRAKAINIIKMSNGMEYVDNIVTKAISQRNDTTVNMRKVAVSPLSLHFKHKKFAAA